MCIILLNHIESGVKVFLIEYHLSPNPHPRKLPLMQAHARNHVSVSHRRNINIIRNLKKNSQGQNENWYKLRSMMTGTIMQCSCSTFPSEARFPISSFSSCRVLHLAISILPILLCGVKLSAEIVSCFSFSSFSFSSTKF